VKKFKLREYLELRFSSSELMYMNFVLF